MHDHERGIYASDKAFVRFIIYVRAVQCTCRYKIIKYSCIIAPRYCTWRDHGTISGGARLRLRKPFNFGRGFKPLSHHSRPHSGEELLPSLKISRDGWLCPCAVPSALCPVLSALPCFLPYALPMFCPVAELPAWCA